MKILGGGGEFCFPPDWYSGQFTLTLQMSARESKGAGEVLGTGTMRQRELTDGLSSSCCGYQLTVMDCGKSNGPKANFTRAVTSSKSQLLKLFPISKGGAKEHIIDLFSLLRCFCWAWVRCVICFPKLKRQETA